MAKWGLIDKFKWTIMGLCAAVVFLWALFYINTSYLLERGTLKQMEQTANGILRELERTFLDLEQVSLAMNQMSEVKEFLREEDPLLFQEKAGIAMEKMEEKTGIYSFVDNIIVYDTDGNYYRMKGNISNVQADRIFYDINGKDFPVHVRMKDYIGYADGIYDEGRLVGNVVALMNQTEIARVFDDYSEISELAVALAVDEDIVISNREELVGLTQKKLQENAGLFITKRVGVTSFHILVVYKTGQWSERSIYFLAAVLVTAVLFFVLVIWFMFFWKRHFFMPIANIIDEVDRFDGAQDTYLPLTGEEHFDGLVNQINEMIFRIDEKEKQLFKTQFLLQESEITRQRALIISLKKQINAHFIINGLNIIKVLAEKAEGRMLVEDAKESDFEQMQEMEKVGQMCDGLSFLLRYANAEDEFVTGMEEFFVLQKYINIMEIRYKNKFDAEVDIDDRLEEVSIPRMLLQPVVENAILHGLQSRSGKGRLFIGSEFSQEYVSLIVEDDGVGMTPEQLELLRDKIRNVAEERWENKGTEHIALPNIQKRVESYYGKGYGLSIDIKPGGGTIVKLKIPL